jgi:hypothetical protein
MGAYGQDKVLAGSVPKSPEDNTNNSSEHFNDHGDNVRKHRLDSAAAAG